MNKAVNILLLIILFPIIALSLFIGFDLPIEMLKTSGAQLPFQLQIYIGFAALIGFIGGRRSIKRWVGISMISKIAKFKWNEVMSKERYRQATMYLIMESIFHIFFGLALYEVTEASLPVVIVMLILAFDHLLFALLAKNRQFFRVGITSKAILVADRDVKAIYFTGLRQVSIQQQSIFFDYIKELQLDMPAQCISAEKHAEFREILAHQIDREKVHFSESFKNF